ncbi:DinB family protein [Glaciihabitans sp. UYNi722]|uniref:mycothiol transferase n=1 Tax=Glaciihabitans sp. UYNi722 TaxID=3156344 RepID=UPI003391E66F
MSVSTNLLVDAYDRIRDNLHRVVSGLDEEQLAARPDDEGNSIAWLVWHLTRVQDDHIADTAGSEQLWTSHGWEKRFGLPFETGATGYGQSSGEVGSVRGLSAEQLAGYHDAVHQRTVEYITGLNDSDLEQVVDEAWDPPVTRAIRLVSVISDDLQHVGQAAMVRGLIGRR